MSTDDSTPDMSNMFPHSLVMTGTEQTLRRQRIKQGKYRAWTILPRYGTANSDRWTVLGTPIPGASNPCRDYEDGQFPDLATAYHVLDVCLQLDDGTNEED